ncbi:MAG: nitroreductase family protein [Bacillota bacterium]
MSLCLKRKSIRDYKPDAIEENKIHALLKSAMQAPSAVNQQPWAFYVITNRTVLNKLGDISNGSRHLKKAPLAILTLIDQNCKRPEMAPTDLAAATQNMLLEAVNQDLGGLWIGVHPREERIDAIRKIVDLPSNLSPFSLVAIGVPNQSTEVTHYRYDEAKITRLD